MSLLQIDIGLFVWTLITFGLLFLLVWRFAFGPLRRVLDEREKTIRDSLDAARQARAEADRIQAEGAAQIREAKEAAQKIIDEGHKLAVRIEEEAVQKARQEAAGILDQTRKEMDRELRKSVDELRNAVAHVSMQVTRQFIKENLDERRHEQIVDEYLERLRRSYERERK